MVDLERPWQISSEVVDFKKITCGLKKVMVGFDKIVVDFEKLRLISRNRGWFGKIVADCGKTVADVETLSLVSGKLRSI